MKLANTKTKKAIIISVGTLFILIGLIQFFSSYVAKYLIETYDEKYTGRQITLGRVYLNPLNGFIYLKNLKVYESGISNALTNPDSVFLSVKGLSANFALRKLLFKNIEISKLTLNQPKGIVIQHKTHINFSDLIARFTNEDADTTPSTYAFNLLKIKIKDGEFHYREALIPINYYIKNVCIESPGIRHNVDSLAVKFSFANGTGSGDAAGKISVNIKSLDYKLAVLIQKFDLDIIQQYLNDLTNFGSFTANLDVDLSSVGNFKIVDSVTNKGLVVINDFHFGKTSYEDYASFKKLVLGIHQVSPGKHVYWYDSVLLLQPYFNYERYDSLDNLQTQFGKDGSNITDVKADKTKFNLVLEIADYAKELAKNFYKSNYKVDKILIENASINYSDYSLTESFSIQANPLTISADSINRLSKNIIFSVKSGIQPYGDLSAKLNINPQDSSDFDLEYKLQGLPIAMFNPYIINYTSYPADRGTLEISGAWDVNKGSIKSSNHLLVIDPRLNDKLDKNNKKHIPLPLIMYLIRDRGNVIDFSIPITGNLNDPDFHISDVIFDVLENILVKPPLTPYREEIKTIENEIEKSLSLKWLPRQQVLQESHMEFFDKIADFLQSNPNESIDVYPNPYISKEKEYILFFEAKKSYFFHSHNDVKVLSKNDSLELEKMSVKEDAIVSYLRSQVNDNLLFTVQDLCFKLVGTAVVDSKFAQLSAQREAAFMKHFNQRGVGNRVKIKKTITDIPYNGFSRYQIDYKGEFPAELTDAYKRLNEFDEKKPRRKFEKKRNESNKQDSTVN
jgi:hypothetical protein